MSDHKVFQISNYTSQVCFGGKPKRACTCDTYKIIVIGIGIIMTTVYCCYHIISYYTYVYSIQQITNICISCFVRKIPIMSYPYRRPVPVLLS